MFNVLSLVLSVTAVVISGVFAARQVSFAGKANQQLPLVAVMWENFRDPSFYEHEDPAT